VNDPVYFLDFLDKAAAQGLQFLAESDPYNLSTAHFSEQVRAQLDALPDRRIREQYLDFIYCRSFRQTLLCRTGHNLAPALNPDALAHLWIAGALVAESKPQFNDNEVMVFRTARGTKVKVMEAIPTAVYLALGDAYPRGLRYEELLSRALKSVNIDRESLPEDVEGKIVRMILSSYVNGVIELRPYQPELPTAISERPIASTLARKQAAADGSVVSCLLESNPMTDAFPRQLLRLLDGTRDRERLRRDMGSAISDEQIAAGLELLRRSAMLIA
jgi:methyltransferase-like protein